MMTDDGKIRFKSAEIKTNLPGFLDNGAQDGLKWTCDVRHTKQKEVYFTWKIHWDEFCGSRKVAKMNGKIVSYCFNVAQKFYTPVISNHELKKSGEEFSIFTGNTMDQLLYKDGSYWFKYVFEFEPIFDETFGTGIVLALEGNKRLAVNRERLSSHSSVFSSIFSAYKNYEEVPLDDVTVEEIRALDDVYGKNPVMPNVKVLPRLLELAERFEMKPSLNAIAEFQLQISDELSLMEKLSIADKYKMEKLFQSSIESLKSIDDVKKVSDGCEFSDNVKLQLFQRILTIS